MASTHTNLCTITDHGIRYFLTCINDYSQYVTVYYLKTKDEATKTITEYLAMVHTQFDHMPKALCADNRKEYVNQALITWCSERRIQLQFIAPYTPQQNGVAECFNQTLVELAHTMWEAKKLPESLQPTMIAHAAYLWNWAFTNALKTMTPYEHWHLKKPDVTHLWENGSPVIILIEGKNVPKLNPKSSGTPICWIWWWNFICKVLQQANKMLRSPSLARVSTQWVWHK